MRQINDLISKILVLCPAAIVTVRDNDYDTVEWTDLKGAQQPTFEQCNAVTVNELKTAKENEEKVSLRALLQKTSGVDRLILKAMFKDLKARNVVTTVDDFINYLYT